MQTKIGRMRPAIRDAMNAFRSKRSKVRLNSVISNERLGLKLNVAIHDLSTTGVKLQVLNMHQVPDTFLLEIPEQGFKAECTLRWRGSGFVGATFTDKQANLLMV